MNQQEASVGVVGVWKRLVCSMVGAGLAEVVTFPICTLRTRYVSDEGHAFGRVRDLFRHMMTHGSRRNAFWSGCFPAVVSQMVSTGSKFTLFWMLKDWRRTPTSTRPIDLANNMVNGMVSGVVGGLLVHPFDVWKTHRQRPEVSFRCELNRHGSLMLWRGAYATISKSIILYGLLFPIYELNKHLLANHSHRHNRGRHWFDVSMASVGTTVVTTMITQSVEYWKLRRMAGQPVYQSGKQMYRGYSLTLARAIPHFLITTSAIEFLLSSNLIIGL